MKQGKANSFAKRTYWSLQTLSSNNIRDDSTLGHHQMVSTKMRLVIFFAAKDGEAPYDQQKKKDQKMTVAQIMNAWLQNSDFIYLFIYFFNSDFKLKKVGKTTRSFRYDLNQIPYDSTVEVTNRFKGLDMIECLKNYGQRLVTLYRRLWSRPSPRKTNAKEKRKDIHIWMQSSKE